MSNKLVAVSLLTLTLALAACGSPKKSPDDQSGGGGPGGKSPQFSKGDEATCQRAGGFVTSDNIACVIEITRTLGEGTGNDGTRYFAIDTSFHDGKFIVAEAPLQVALVTLNHHQLGTASGFRRVVLNTGLQAAELGIQLLRTVRKDENVTLNSYECRDSNMSIVGCLDSWIP